MGDGLYLGETLYDGQRHTQVVPYAVARDGAWRPVENWIERLPTRGRVFAPTKPPFAVGELFAFETVANAGGGGLDRFRLGDTWEVDQILDYTMSDLEDARRAVVEVGVADLHPGTTHVVVALAGDRCVRLAMMPEGTADNRSLARIEGLEELAVHAFDSRSIAGAMVRGRHLTLPDTVGRRIGTVDWRRDADFLEAALRRLRRIDGAGDAPTRAQVGQVVSWLTKAGLSAGLAADLGAMRDRLVASAERISLGTAAAQEIARAIAALPPIAERLDVEIATRRDEILATVLSEAEALVRADVASRTAEATAALQTKAAELATLERGIGEAQAALRETQERHQALHEAVSDALVGLGEALEGAPGSKAAALARRLGERLKDPELAERLVADPRPPWTRVRARGISTMPWDRVADALARTARRRGFASEALFAADVAARAGELVVLPDDVAGAFVRCYADVVAGGAFARLVLDPSTISLDDLWRLPPAGVPTAMAQAWTRSQLDPRTYRIVLLDGLHRTPFDLWLPSFLDVLAAPDRPPAFSYSRRSPTR